MTRKYLRSPPHFDILWLPKAAIRSVERDSSDCILIVGVSRPKVAIAILAIIIISLCLTFHMLYDSAVHSIINSRNEQEHIIKQQQIFLFARGRMYPSPARRLPQAIIVGVRKCGTRALLEMLFLHPMIQKAAGEVHFFDRDENYNKGLEWYRMRMPHSYAGQITIEKSPSYFVTPEVPERIYAMNSSIKLLIIVREPVTRAISDYTQLRAHAATANPAMISQPNQYVLSPSSSSSSSSSSSYSGAATPQPTQQQQQQQQQSKSFEELSQHPNGTVNQAYRPLAISVYHNYLHRWLETFSRDQILVVNGDLLIEDPVPQLQRIEKFLGLAPHIGIHNFYFNETKGFYCLRNETSDRCLRETKGRRHPRVNPLVVTKLRKYFAEHNQKFYELIGEDLGWPEE